MAFAINKKTKEVLDVRSDEELESLLLAFEEDGVLDNWEIKDSIDENSNEVLQTADNATGREARYETASKAAQGNASEEVANRAMADLFPNATNHAMNGGGTAGTFARAAGDLVTAVPRAIYGLGEAAVNRATGMGEADPGRAFGRDVEEARKETVPVLGMAYDPVAVAGMAASGGAAAATRGMGTLARSALQGGINSAFGAADAYENGGSVGLGAAIGGAAGVGGEVLSDVAKYLYAGKAKEALMELAARAFYGKKKESINQDILLHKLLGSQGEIEWLMDQLPAGRKGQREALEKAYTDLRREAEGMNLDMPSGGLAQGVRKTRFVGPHEFDDIPSSSEEALNAQIARLNGIGENIDRRIGDLRNDTRMTRAASSERAGDIKDLQYGLGENQLKKNQNNWHKRTLRMDLDPNISEQEKREIKDQLDLENLFLDKEAIEARKRVNAVRGELNTASREASVNSQRVAELQKTRASVKKQISDNKKKLEQEQAARAIVNARAPYYQDSNVELIAASDKFAEFQDNLRKNIGKAVDETVSATRNVDGSHRINGSTGLPFTPATEEYGNLMMDFVFNPVEAPIQASGHGGLGTGQVTTDKIIEVMDRLALVNDDRATKAFLDSITWFSPEQKQKLLENVRRRNVALKAHSGFDFQNLPEEGRADFLKKLARASSLKINNVVQQFGGAQAGKAYPGNPQRMSRDFGGVPGIREYQFGNPLERVLKRERAAGLGARVAPYIYGNSGE